MDNRNPNPCGAKLVSSALLGLDFRTIVVNDRSYIVHPPTIAKLAGATYWLSEVGESNSIREMLMQMQNSRNIAVALSHFITGDDSLADELAQGTLDELIEGLEESLSLIDATNFIKLSTLLRSVSRLIAKQSTSATTASSVR